MTKRTKQFKALNSLFHLRFASKNGSKRRICRNGKRRDPVSRILAKCQSPSEIGTAAVAFGVDSDEVMRRGKTAPNFGQFRMAIGNRMRGELGKMVCRLAGKS